MQENYQTTKGAGAGANNGPGYPPNASWSNPSRITTDDGSSASIGFFEGGQSGDSLVASSFGFSFPPNARIDGISVLVDGSQTGSFGTVALNATGTSTKDMGALNQVYGGSTDLWGADEISVADVESLTFSINANDLSGGDGIASVDYVEITVYWHIEMPNLAADVPTRVEYKVYSRDGNFLGLLPNVTSPLAFPEDINSGGTSMVITCGKLANNEVTVDPLLTESGDPITTEDDLPILATSTDLLLARGNSVDEAIFKNSNKLKIWLFNKYYPNGKLMFSGQINRVSFKYGGGDASVKLTVYSDGLELNNYIACGYPFSYTDDQEQTTSNDKVSLQRADGGFVYWGQTFRTGAGITNIGAIDLKMDGIAMVTVAILNTINGNVLGSVTKLVNVPPNSIVTLEFPQLIELEPETDYFISTSVGSNQSIWLYRNTAGGYSNGSLYTAVYTGGSGGGNFVEVPGNDLYFVTKSGEPTTTATYSSDDPTTDMASGIFQDYNNRGGVITEREFEATGLSLTYTFVVAFISDALKKILELCPAGFYSYIDVGTAEIDIKQTSTNPDFTVVKGRHINELNIDMTIEQVKNYLLLTGGDTGGGSNLYRDYKDSQSSSFYGLRTATKTDNRVTLTTTADAIGSTFIEEKSGELQETTLTVLNEHIDITLLTPGKTIGFRNFGNFIDDLVLQVVRREGNYSKGFAVLTLGLLPVRMNDKVQQITRELLNEQTINNPSSPS